MKVIRFFCIGVVTMGLILLSAERNFAASAKYPIRPIQVVIPYEPGATDLSLRPFVDYMPEYLGQPMTFVYKPGAVGAVGTGSVATSKPDGYTILGASGSTVILPITQKNISYTLDSFTPVCNVAQAFSALFVQSNARWKNLAELVAEAKKNPGKINFTSGGTLGIHHLLVEGFSREAGITLNHIPAQGGGPAITALLGGHVDMAVGAVTSGLPHVLAGTLRPIGIFSSKRISDLPDYPTILEQGFGPKEVPSATYGFLAPKGTPPDVVEALNSAAKMVLENKKLLLVDRYKKIGAEIFYLPPQEHGANLRSHHVFFSSAVKDLIK